MTNLDTFLQKLTDRLNEYKTRLELTYFKEFKVEVTSGRKYQKVFSVQVCEDQSVPSQGRNLVAFLDADGNIYKPATFVAPAKHVRGNINSDQNGMEAIDENGHVVYLK